MLSWNHFKPKQFQTIIYINKLVTDYCFYIRFCLQKESHLCQWKYIVYLNMIFLAYHFI